MTRPTVLRGGALSRERSSNLNRFWCLEDTVRKISCASVATCRRFLRKETVVTIATISNDVSSQQWQWRAGQATVLETEAVACS